MGLAAYCTFLSTHSRGVQEAANVRCLVRSSGGGAAWGYDVGSWALARSSMKSTQSQRSELAKSRDSEAILQVTDFRDYLDCF